MTVNLLLIVQSAAWSGWMIENLSMVLIWVRSVFVHLMGEEGRSKKKRKFVFYLLVLAITGSYAKPFWV